MKNQNKKINPSDQFIMNNISYHDLIELYNFKRSSIKMIEKKEEKKRVIKKIMIQIDDKVYSSLSEGMRDHGLLSPLDKNESKRSPSREAQYQAELKIWNKINRGIKKNESYSYEGHDFKMI